MVSRLSLVVLLVVVASGLALPKHKRDAPENLCDRNPCGYNRICNQLFNAAGRPYVQCTRNHTQSCDDMDCGENGYCMDDYYGVHCRCQNHYYGSQCEHYQDPCEHMNCENGGTCVVEDMPYGGWNTKCECPSGFGGYRCQAEMDVRDIYVNADEEYVLQYPEAGTGGYTPDYANNIHIQWNVHSTQPGMEFVVELGEGDYFETESCCDSLRIEDDEGEDCGDYRGCIVEGRMATVNSDLMRLKFSTDYSVVRRGFCLKIRLVDPAEDPCSENPCINGETCDSATAQCVATPDFQTYNCPSNYNNNNHGYTTTMYPNIVAGGYGTTPPYTGNGNGNNGNGNGNGGPNYYYTTTEQAIVEPQYLSFDLTDENTPFNLTLSAEEYVNQMDVTWDFQTQEANRGIVVSAMRFDVERNYDFLYISDVSNTTEFDGNDHRGQLFRTPFASVSLHFVTDYSVTHSGFTLLVDLV